MINIALHIKYLLLNHDCVIIPGWGALIAHCLPARIDLSSNMIYPPSRVVVFNSSITHNDGLLANALSRRETMSYEAACNAISVYVAAMRSQLDKTGLLRLERVGDFRLTPDRTIVFEPAIDNIVAARFIGLPPVDLSSLKVEQPIEETPSPVIEDEIAEVDETSTGKFMWRGSALRIAATVAVILGLGFMLITGVRNLTTSTSEGVEMASIVDIPSMLPADDESDQSPISGSDNSDSTNDITDEPATASAIPVQDIPEDFPALRNAAESQSHRYYLIVASFATRSKAELYVKLHEDEQLSILECEKRYRVYAASGNSTVEARLPLSDNGFRKRNPEAWVFEK